MMRTRILPAANALYTIEGTQLAGDEAGAVNWWLAAAAIVSLAALVAVLVLAQWWMSGHFRRTLNVPLVVATVLVATLGLVRGGAARPECRRHLGDGPRIRSHRSLHAGPHRRPGDASGRRADPADPGLGAVVPEGLCSDVPSLKWSTGSEGWKGSGAQAQLARAQKAFTTYSAVHKHIRSLDARVTSTKPRHWHQDRDPMTSRQWRRNWMWSSPVPSPTPNETSTPPCRVRPAISGAYWRRPPCWPLSRLPSSSLASAPGFQSTGRPRHGPLLDISPSSPNFRLDHLAAIRFGPGIGRLRECSAGHVGAGGNPGGTGASRRGPHCASHRP